MSRAGRRIFLLVLFTFIMMFFGMVLPGMAGEEWVRGDGTPLEEEVFFVAGFPDKKTDVRLSLDPKHPESAEYYAIFPSYTDTAGIFLRLFGRNQFVLMDVYGNAQVYRDGDRLPDIGASEIWYADIRSESGELRAHGKLHFVRAYDIPSVFIRTDSRDMAYIDEDKSHSEEGEISVRSESGAIIYEGSIKSLKGHGNSTWKKAKKPYQITLRDKADLFGMGRARKWILLANYMDHSQIRNSITYDMARSIEGEFVPESVYVELYLNGRCNGLYQLTEKIEVDEERLDITDLQKENEIADSKKLLSKHSVRRNGRDKSFVMGMDQAELPKDISGGYLIEHDYGWKYEEEPVRFSTEGGDTYVLSFPADAPIGEVEYIGGLFQELEDRIGAGETLDGFIDLESFAERYALEELVQDEGAGITSSYYYKDADRVDPLIHAGPYWDYDQSYGNTPYELMNDPRVLNFCTAHGQNTVLFYDLWTRYPAFRSLVCGCYREKLRPFIMELLNGGLDIYAERIRANAEADMGRWSRDPDSVSHSVEDIREFLSERVKFLDRVWLDGEHFHIVYFDTPARKRQLYLGILDGESIRCIPNFSGKKGSVWVDKETGEIVDDSTPIKKDRILIDKNEEKNQ